MEPKKILVVSSSFYPENSPRAFRTTELVKELARQGHEVSLITRKVNGQHEQFEKEYGISIENLGRLKLPAIDYAKGTLLLKLLKRACGRALLQFFEYPEIELMYRVKKVLQNRGVYDLLISIAVPYPNHWGVAWARSSSNPIARTWVADCGDPYMLAQHDSFNKPFYFGYLEKWFSRKADYISITNIRMKERYYPEFHHKIVEIPQGFDFGEVRIAEYKPNAIPTFAFAGLFMKDSRDPSALLEYLSALETDFKFVVYPRKTDLLLPFRDRLGDKMEIREIIPRQQLIYELSTMDFLVNIGYDERNQSPSKLIDYYLTGRPVLSLQSNVADEKLLGQFFRGNYEGKFHYENIDRYRIEQVCNQFLALCNQPA